MKKRLAELEARDKAREERLAKLEQFIPAAPKSGKAKAALTEDSPPAKY